MIIGRKIFGFGTEDNEEDNISGISSDVVPAVDNYVKTPIQTETAKRRSRRNQNMVSAEVLE